MPSSARNLVSSLAARLHSQQIAHGGRKSDPRKEGDRADGRENNNEAFGQQRVGRSGRNQFRHSTVDNFMVRKRRHRVPPPPFSLDGIASS